MTNLVLGKSMSWADNTCVLDWGWRRVRPSRGRWETYDGSEAVYVYEPGQCRQHPKPWVFYVTCPLHELRERAKELTWLLHSGEAELAPIDRRRQVAKAIDNETEME